MESDKYFTVQEDKCVCVRETYAAIYKLYVYTHHTNPQSSCTHFFIQIQQVDHYGEKMAVSPDN